MKLVITNLSNNLYHSSRLNLNYSSLKHGIGHISSYEFEEIKGSSFYNENIKILSQSKGIGYWLWKPYIILQTLKKFDIGDIVIYSDCGVEIIQNLKPLIDLCNNKTDILLFANSNLINKRWTKKDCFILMDCDEDKYWNGLQCDAAFCLFKKSSKSIAFLEEWLLHGTNINILTDLPNICGSLNFPEFIEHRWDQSILSLLAIKHNIELYRMPTQFGNHYKMPQYRVDGEFNCINQSDYAQLNHYSANPSNNSFYPQLLKHHRVKDINDDILANSNKIKIHNLISIKIISKFKYYTKKSIFILIRCVTSIKK